MSTDLTTAPHALALRTGRRAAPWKSLQGPAHKNPDTPQQKRMQLEVCPALHTIINAPGALKPLDDAVLPLSRMETDGVALERAVDSIILILKPSVFTSLFSLRSTLSKIFVVFLSLLIAGAVAMFVKKRFERRSSANIKGA